MTEFIETIENNPKTQKDIEVIATIYSNQTLIPFCSIGTNCSYRREITLEIKCFKVSVTTIKEMINYFKDEIKRSGKK